MISAEKRFIPFFCNVKYHLLDCRCGLICNALSLGLCVRWNCVSFSIGFGTQETALSLFQHYLCIMSFTSTASIWSRRFCILVFRTVCRSCVCALRVWSWTIIILVVGTGTKVFRFAENPVFFFSLGPNEHNDGSVATSSFRSLSICTKFPKNETTKIPASENQLTHTGKM